MLQCPYRKLIDQIYDTALEPDRWQRTLTDVAAMIGCVHLSVIPCDDPAETVATEGSEECLPLYQTYWHKYDSTLEIFSKNKKNFGFFYDWSFLGENCFKKDPYYQEFMRPFGMGHHGGATFELYPGEIYALGINFPYGKAPPDPIDLEQIEVVSRHVIRALAISARTSGLDHGQAGLAEAMDHLPCGAAILDHDGRLIFVNPVLEGLAGDGLAMAEGYVHCTRPDDQKSLERLIESASKPSLGPGEPDTLSVRRREGRRPLLIRAIPVSRERIVGLRSKGPHRKQVLLLVVDLDTEPLGAPDSALRLLGLTPAEARVAAAIGSGYSPQETASLLGSAEGTVRNQLKHIFSKLDISRQTDLVRLADRLSILRKP